MLNQLTTWLRALAHQHREYLLIIAAVLSFFLSKIIFRMLDPTTGVYDIGVLQNNVTAVISLLIFQFTTWKVLCHIWPDLRTYFETKFSEDFNDLQPWQKLKLSAFVYFSYIAALVFLSKTIQG